MIPGLRGDEPHETALPRVLPRRGPDCRAWFGRVLWVSPERFARKGNARVQINVSARHGQLSGATQSKIVSKVSRLKRYFNRLTALNVTVDLENESLPTVEIVASAEHFHEMVSREHSSQLWRSVDGAVQKLEQQLRKHKEKVLDHKHVSSTLES